VRSAAQAGVRCKRSILDGGAKLKVFKGIVAGILGLTIIFYCVNAILVPVPPIVTDAHLSDLRVASILGLTFGVVLIYTSYLIFRGKSNEQLENGLATIGLALLLLFLWPYLQFQYWRTGNKEFSSSSLAWGTVVTIAAFSRGIWLIYKQRGTKRIGGKAGGRV
jgi:hypothetical protein